MIQSLFCALSRETAYSVFRSGPLKATLITSRGVGIRPRFLPSGPITCTPALAGHIEAPGGVKRAAIAAESAALQLGEFALVGERAILLDVKRRDASGRW